MVSVVPGLPPGGVVPLDGARDGSFTIGIPGDHVLTNLGVIEKFLPLKSEITEADRGLRIVSLTPR